MTAGFWHSTFWPSEFWPTDFWAEYGLATPPTPPYVYAVCRMYGDIITQCRISTDIMALSFMDDSLNAQSRIETDVKTVSIMKTTHVTESRS